MARVTIATVLVLRPGGVVAVTRPEGGFAMPGGHVEPGETAAQGARRELYEETGLAAAVLWPLCRVTSGRADVVGFYAPSATGALRGSAEGAAVVVEPALLVAGPYGDFARRCFAAAASIGA